MAKVYPLVQKYMTKLSLNAILANVVLYSFLKVKSTDTLASTYRIEERDLGEIIDDLNKVLKPQNH